MSTNGLISLDSLDREAYTPVSFSTGVQESLIAPFWADVDTNGIGNIFFWNTTQQILLNNASKIINDAFSGSHFDPQYLIIVTWLEVGYFEAHTDKV